MHMFAPDVPFPPSPGVPFPPDPVSPQIRYMFSPRSDQIRMVFSYPVSRPQIPEHLFYPPRSGFSTELAEHRQYEKRQRIASMGAAKYTLSRYVKHIRKQIRENRERLEADRLARQQQAMLKRSSMQKTIEMGKFFKGRTPRGKMFRVVNFWLIALTISATVVVSMPDVAANRDVEFGLHALQKLGLGFFTVEYLGLLYSAVGSKHWKFSRRNFATSFQVICPPLCLCQHQQHLQEPSI